MIQNGGFETGSLAPWVVQDTNPPPVVSNAQAHSGTYSVLVGTVSGGEPNGNGSLYQAFTPPAGATLSFWYYPGTTDSLTFDWQDVYLTDSNGAILATLLHVCENDLTWKHVTFQSGPVCRPIGAHQVPRPPGRLRRRYLHVRRRRSGAGRLRHHLAHADGDHGDRPR